MNTPIDKLVSAREMAAHALEMGYQPGWIGGLHLRAAEQHGNESREARYWSAVYAWACRAWGRQERSER